MGIADDDDDDEASAWTYLQLGHEGEDLLSMTKRWQFEQANATILLPIDDDESSQPLVVMIMSLCPPADMLSSKSNFCSSGRFHLFLPVFLFTKYILPVCTVNTNIYQ